MARSAARPTRLTELERRPNPVEKGPTEEDLMAAYVRGDRPAFQALFARVAPPVHGFFRRCFTDEAVADDLFQTTFMKLHQGRSAYQPGRPLRPWLFGASKLKRVPRV